MSHHDTTPDPSPAASLATSPDTNQASVTERQLQRLIVPEPAAYESGIRVDVIHDPDLTLLWGGHR